MSLAACASIEPKPLKVADIRQQAQLDRAAAQSDVPPLSAPLSLDEAIARALKYNLERRTRLMDEAIAFNQFDLSRYDMLPKLVASAGYQSNDEYATRRATDAVTGQPSLANPFISSEKSHTLSELGLTWNLLDFGLSYHNAKQNADRALIAVERRRKAMHTLIQEVRTAFWRVTSAQKLRGEVKQAIEEAEDALADARKAEDARVRSPLDALRYQRQVLESLRLLETIEQDLSTASVELATLINVPLAVNLQVIEPGETLSRAMLEQPVESMEEAAIARNADLREQFYNARLATEETRKAMLRMFPSLNLSYSTKHDDDQYLVHRTWNEAGARLSFSLLNLLSAPTQMKLADAGVALADQRRVATQMAVLAQVHVARLQYANAFQQYQRADAIWRVDDRINHHVANREQAQTQSKLDKVANNTAAILSQLRRYQSLAQAHAAASKLQATLGMEPEIGSVQELSLDELQTAIRTARAGWDSGSLVPLPLPSETAQPGPAGGTASALPVGAAGVETSELPQATQTPAETPAAATAAPAAEAASAVPAGRTVCSARTGPGMPVTECIVSNPPMAGIPGRTLAKPGASAGGWIVRLGSFRKPASVSLVVGRTRALSLPVFTAEFTPGGTRRTLVRAGPFASQQEAEAARARLAEVNLAGNVTPL